MVLLNESKDVFRLGGEPTPFVKHFINTGDHPPVSTAPYRLSSNRKYDGEKKGNFYHRSNSDTRGRRYGPNSHEKHNNKNQNYQDARRQHYDSEVNNKSDCAQISNESLNEASESISPSDKECFQNNQPECDDKNESKRQDICAGNSSKGAFFDRQRRNAYRSDTHFQDGRRDSFKRGKTK
ncbi:hypothetical protein TNIN_238111 [Trichonephila inaurata madagascariensis]|uniref:Uncharacterized protein n=1 Tax=Trichonephila inaurata madagascariensis TaxID=2747483 RepID=A0A8X6XGU6_9ARAC|nr:hypothetical protein TNIN_238111 [Trichonephila inaurata madagascariensis]